MGTTIVPASLADKVVFYEQHNAPWAANSVAIGVTSAEVTALNTKTTAARAALEAHRAAQQAAEAATLNFKNTVKTMNDAGVLLIAKIKTKAATDGDNVYVLAQIPAPAIPGPVPAPGTPSNFTVELLQNGSLVLKWKCPNPPGASGTIYSVSRKIGTGTFSYIGGTGERKFIDATLPLGSGAVTYQIVAVRSTTQGTPAQFNVNFGVGGGGEMVASIAQAPRMAA